jgi:hypothetical protein
MTDKFGEKKTPDFNQAFNNNLQSFIHHQNLQLNCHLHLLAF